MTTLRYFIVGLLCALALTICAQSLTKPFKWTENGQEYTATLNEMQELIDEQLKEMVRRMNEQTPLRIDEATTLMSSIYLNSEVQHNYRIDIDSSKLSDTQKENFIAKMKTKQAATMKYLMVDANVDLLSRAEWIRLYKDLKIKFVYNMRDNQGVVFGRVVVDYKDF